MSKKHFAYLLATTLLAAPAFAQGTSPGSTAPSAPSSATSPSMPGSGGTDTQRGNTPGVGGATGAQGSPMSGANSGSSTMRSSTASADVNTPLSSPGVAQMMASDIRGTRVYGANNENVGDISDILLSREGDIVALVVGVGGFLGIGQKDVAIPFKAFEFVTEGQASANRSSTSTSTSGTGSASRATSTDTSMTTGSTATSPRTTSYPASSLGAATAPGSAPSVSGTTSSMTDGARSGSGSAVTGSTPGATSSTSISGSQAAGLLKPERIVLRGMTRADLESAPQFEKKVASPQR